MRLIFGWPLAASRSLTSACAGNLAPAGPRFQPLEPGAGLAAHGRFRARLARICYRWDQQRSIPLAVFAPLAAVPNVELISLQQGEGTETLQDAAFPVTVVFDDPAVPLADFADVAAAMKHLDLVVSADTVIAHLAGALARAADWRWLMHRDDMPWYPTMRLFRQRHWGIGGSYLTGWRRASASSTSRNILEDFGAK